MERSATSPSERRSAFPPVLLIGVWSTPPCNICDSERDEGVVLARGRSDVDRASFCLPIADRARLARSVLSPPFPFARKVHDEGPRVFLRQHEGTSWPARSYTRANVHNADAWNNALAQIAIVSLHIMSQSKFPGHWFIGRKYKRFPGEELNTRRRFLDFMIGLRFVEFASAEDHNRTSGYHLPVQ